MTRAVWLSRGSRRQPVSLLAINTGWNVSPSRTGSTAVSQIVDTIVISALVWGTKLSFDQYVTVVLTSYLIKLTAAIAVTPVIYGLHELIERRFGVHPAPAEVASADLST